MTIRSIEKIRDSFPHIFQIADETASGNREKIFLPQNKGALECSLVSVPIRDFGGRSVGAMVCLRQLEKRMAFTFDDITAIEALGVVFATFYELLSSEEHRLSALGRLGHELRGPVTGMKAAISFSRRFSSLHPMLERYLRDMTSYTQIMTDVLSNIEIATEERLPEKLSKERVHLVNDLIAPAMAAVEDSLPGRGISESSIRRPGLSFAPRMMLDKARMMQVVFNLLENAVKYSTQSSPTIRIDVTFEKRNGRYEISFRDWGIGVPEGYEERIFMMGVRAPNTIDKTATGKGYGLAISRKIVRAHGGELVYRRHGDGSEFVIVLPASVDADTTGA
jgi:signal transduction histidine kinase